MEKEIAIFGAGILGQEAARYYKIHGCEVKCFIDNAEKKQGTILNDIPVCGLEEYQGKYNCDIAIPGGHRKEIETQLLNAGIKNYYFYDNQIYSDRERIISYCEEDEMEDVILYHLLKTEKEVFYIDVGSNDPTVGSVTKLLYDRLSAHGINIEPQPSLMTQTKRERLRDINLTVGVGQTRGGRAKLFLQGGLTTACNVNCISSKINSLEIEIKTLESICRQYVPKNTVISFLKIDVEGMEKDVLLGADFHDFRPKIIVIESTKPNTDVPTFSEWEHILIENDYVAGFMKGVNRFYFAKERYDDYKNKISEIEHLERYYFVERMSRFFCF